MKDPQTNRYRFATRTIHAGQPPEAMTGAVMTPVFQTSTYAQESPGKHRGYDYARTANPTRTAYEECLASLEEARHALAFSSGLATIDAIIHLLEVGDHVVCCDDVYGGTFRIFDKVFRRQGIEFSFVDMSEINEVQKAFRPKTKLLWMESPTNPMLKILDLHALTSLAQRKGAWSVVDNTFMSPYFQQPLKLGANIVMHSVTKYMNGHSDVIGGALMTNDASLYERLQFNQNAIGAVPAPWDCFLVMRGLKTLVVRMQRHEQNALELARFLESSNKIEKVLYPGLPSHPQYTLAQKQMSGFGGMISFFLKGGLSEAKRFLNQVKIFTLAESLGGVESLIEHPAIMTHASIPPENRKLLGIHDNFIRISTGIEDVQDLKDDLQQALEAI